MGLRNFNFSDFTNHPIFQKVVEVQTKSVDFFQSHTQSTFCALAVINLTGAYIATKLSNLIGKHLPTSVKVLKPLVEFSVYAATFYVINAYVVPLLLGITISNPYIAILAISAYAIKLIIENNKYNKLQSDYRSVCDGYYNQMIKIKKLKEKKTKLITEKNQLITEKEPLITEKNKQTEENAKSINEINKLKNLLKKSRNRNLNLKNRIETLKTKPENQNSNNNQVKEEKIEETVVGNTTLNNE